jgi:O-antigen ligase
MDNVTAGFTTGVDTRRRKRKAALPQSLLVLDCVILTLLALLPIAGIWIFGGNRLWAMGPMILLTLCAGALFVFRVGISTYRSELNCPPGGKLLLVYLCYLAALIPFAEIPYEAVMELFRFVSYIIAFWIWINLLRHGQRWKVLLVLLMLSISIMAWYALILDVHGSNMVLNQPRPAQYGMRASGAYICPNHFANLLEMIIPVGIGILLCREMGISVRLIAGYTVLISLPALFLTESRSGWIGLMTGIVVLAVALSLRKGFKQFIAVLLAAPLLAAATGFVVWKMSPRVQARVEQALNGDVRVVIWKDTLEMVKDHPVFGSGLGSYRWMYPHYRKHMIENADPEFAHNDYLHYWAESGAVGLAIMAAVVVMIVMRSVRIIRRDEDEKNVYLAGAMLGAMSGALVHAFFDFNFHIFANTHVFIFICGCLIAATPDRKVDRVFDMKPNRISWISTGLVVLLLMLAGYYSRTMVSYAYVRAAGENVKSMRWDLAQKQYKKAMDWSPSSWKAHIGYAHLLRTRSFWVRDKVLKQQWIDLAHVHYNKSLKQNPWEIDAVYGLSGLYKVSGDQEKALELRRKAVAMVPRHVFYLNELGLQLKDMGRHQEALDVFLESRAIEPTPAAERNIRWLQTHLNNP